MNIALTMTTLLANGDVQEGEYALPPMFTLFDALHKAKIGYCVLHGYEAFPNVETVDIDCIIDRTVSPDDFGRILDETCKTHGWWLVEHSKYFAVIASRDVSGAFQIINLDFEVDCKTSGYVSFTGEEVLAGRKWTGRFWIPACEVEFSAYLIRCILKRSLNGERMSRLSRVYSQNPAKCREMLARFWSKDQTDAICQSIAENDLSNLIGIAPRLRAHIVGLLLRKNPSLYAVSAIDSFGAMIGRFCKPRGLQVVMLGQDGAGKSSVISALETGLSKIFPAQKFAVLPRHYIGSSSGAQSRPTPRTHSPPARLLYRSCVLATGLHLIVTVVWLLAGIRGKTE